MHNIEILRQLRIGEYAVFDLTIAFVGIFFVSPILSNLFLKLGIDIPKRNWLLLTLPISILVHVLIGNMTIMTKNFFDPNGHYILKLLIVIVFIFGLKGIRVVKLKARKKRLN